MPTDQDWAELAGQYGAAGTNEAWKAVFEHYHHDRMEEAVAAAVPLGSGPGANQLNTYRMLEAEAGTRSSPPNLG